MKCSDEDAAIVVFSEDVGGQVMRINGLLIMHTFLMGVMVGIGAYGHRYRHHRLIRYLFLGVTILFLPIVSYIISTASNLKVVAVGLDGQPQESFSMVCSKKMLLILLLWSALVQIVGINTTVIVAGDAREARDIAPSVVLLVEAIWTGYLLAIEVTKLDSDDHSFTYVRILAFFPPWALIFVKLLLKYYSWYQARKSLALGYNPHVIRGYMEQLQAYRSHQVDLESDMPPPLIVTGEDSESVQKYSFGYRFKFRSNRSGDHRTRMIQEDGLVTLEKVWQMLPRSTQLRDVCFSFASFKLLRCRFARYTIADVGFINFFRNVLLEERDAERLLGLIACELTFLHDYYYSSLPVSYSKSWLPILSILISLLSMAYCLLFTLYIVLPRIIEQLGGYHIPQLSCYNKCSSDRIGFGSQWFLVLPLQSLVALVLLAEVREIASYICSNWTKIALIRNHASWQQSTPTMKKWVTGHILQCRCKMLQHWEDKMSLCSIIVFHLTPLARLRRVISLPDQKMKVPTAVKVAIVHALRRQVRAGNMTSSLRLKVGDNLIWTFDDAKGMADIMLVCHIATSILEVRSDPHRAPFDHKVASTHLSCYCAYLVAYSPDLLPDFDDWCKSLYKAVKKDMEQIRLVVPGAATPQVKYQLLLDQLTTRSGHELLKNGAELGRRLVELPQGEDKVWEALAGFWSEIILQVAPSDNLDGHAEAIARGGELITLVWALLGHLGTVTRSEHTVSAIAC